MSKNVKVKFVRGNVRYKGEYLKLGQEYTVTELFYQRNTVRFELVEAKKKAPAKKPKDEPVKDIEEVIAEEAKASE